MFLPIGDYPNPPRYRPWITWGLIAVNVAVFVLISLPLSIQAADPLDPLTAFLAQRSPAGVDAYSVFVFRYGYVPARPSVVTLFTSMFLHGGVAHLAGNMLFLWIFGNNVEHRVGRLLFLVAYLATGALGTLTFGLLDSDAVTPLVGASGAISGALGAYMVFFPRNVVKVFIFLFPFFFDVVHIRAVWVLGFYIVVQNLFPLLFGAQSSVAYGAHFGGFLAGAALAWVMDRGLSRLPGAKRGSARPHADARRARVVRPATHATEEPFPAEDPFPAAVRRRDRARAFALLGELGALHVAQTYPHEALEVAEWLADDGQPAAASDLLRKLLGRARMDRIDKARVYLVLGLVRMQQGQTVSAYQHLASVFDFDPDGDTAERAHEALERLGGVR